MALYGGKPELVLRNALLDPDNNLPRSELEAIDPLKPCAPSADGSLTWTEGCPWSILYYEDSRWRSGEVIDVHVHANNSLGCLPMTDCVHRLHRLSAKIQVCVPGNFHDARTGTRLASDALEKLVIKQNIKRVDVLTSQAVAALIQHKNPVRPQTVGAEYLCSSHSNWFTAPIVLCMFMV